MEGILEPISINQLMQFENYQLLIHYLGWEITFIYNFQHEPQNRHQNNCESSL